MPKYKCKDCGAVWYGWEAKKIQFARNAGANWNLSLKIPLIKNRPGLRKVELGYFLGLWPLIQGPKRRPG